MAKPFHNDTYPGINQSIEFDRIPEKEINIINDLSNNSSLIL